MNDSWSWWFLLRVFYKVTMNTEWVNSDALLPGEIQASGHYICINCSIRNLAPCVHLLKDISFHIHCWLTHLEMGANSTIITTKQGSPHSHILPARHMASSVYFETLGSTLAQGWGAIFNSNLTNKNATKHSTKSTTKRILFAVWKLKNKEGGLFN